MEIYRRIYLIHLERVGNHWRGSFKRNITRLNNYFFLLDLSPYQDWRNHFETTLLCYLLTIVERRVQFMSFANSLARCETQTASVSIWTQIIDERVTVMLSSQQLSENDTVIMRSDVYLT